MTVKSVVYAIIKVKTILLFIANRFYTERDDKIRIISARELTAQERRNYEHGKFE